MSDVGTSKYFELMLIIDVLTCFRVISLSFSFWIHLLGLCVFVSSPYYFPIGSRPLFGVLHKTVGVNV